MNSLIYLDAREIRFANIIFWENSFCYFWGLLERHHGSVQS